MRASLCAAKEAPTMKLDPSFKYYLSSVAWPYALPLIDDNSTPVGLALYAYRCEYCMLADHKEYHYVYYVCENKWFKLRIKT
jgi:hypothetical protein